MFSVANLGAIMVGKICSKGNLTRDLEDIAIGHLLEDFQDFFGAHPTV